MQKVKDIEGNTNVFKAVNNYAYSGLYSQSIDLALVHRERDYEESSGLIYTEGILVHELAHASSMYKGMYSADHKSFPTPRIGFCLSDQKTPWGWLLEEGWADIHRADYFAQYASDEERSNLENTLGFGNLGMEDTVPLKTPSGEILPLPLKYFIINPKGMPDTKTMAFAGYALELLCKRNPSIKPLLVEGRSSVDGLRKLAHAFERIMPGLYSDLQKGSYSLESFCDKLSTVMSDVMGGIQNAITARGLLRDTWNEILPAQK